MDKDTENLAEEFQQKLDGYLPDDFDWNSHIGTLTYAIKTINGKPIGREY